MTITMDEQQIKEACLNWMKNTLAGGFNLELTEDEDDIVFDMCPFTGLSAGIEVEVK